MLVVGARDKLIQAGVAQDGTGETLRVPAGGCNITGPLTLAVICRTTGRDAAFRNLIAGLTSAGVVSGWSLELDNANKLVFDDNGTHTGISSAITSVVADGWQLIAVNATATGNTKPRFHRYKYLTAAWTHEDSATAAVNITGTPGAGGLVEIGGKWGTSTDFFQGQILAAAVWNRVLTDGEYYPLVFSYDYWMQSKPVGFWRPRGQERLRDFAGLGANELSRTGVRPASAAVTVPPPQIDDVQPRDTLLVALASGGPLIIQSVPASTTFSAGTNNVAEQPQAVPANTNFSAGTNGAALAPQSTASLTTFSSLVSVAEQVPSPASLTTYNTGTISFQLGGLNIQAVPANTNFSAGTNTASLVASETAALTTFSTGSVSAAISTPSVGASTTFSTGSPKVEESTTTSGLVTYSGGAVSGASTLQGVPGNTNFSAGVNSAALAPQSPASLTTYSGGNDSLLEAAQIVAALTTFGVGTITIVSGSLILQPTSAGLATYSSVTSLAESTGAVGGTSTFSGGVNSLLSTAKPPPANVNYSTGITAVALTPGGKGTATFSAGTLSGASAATTVVGTVIFSAVSTLLSGAALLDPRGVTTPAGVTVGTVVSSDPSAVISTSGPGAVTQ